MKITPGPGFALLLGALAGCIEPDGPALAETHAALTDSTDHYFVIHNSASRRDTAFFEATADQPTQLAVEVLPGGSAVANVIVDSPSYFAASGNLFTSSGNNSALVRVTALSSVARVALVVRQETRQGNVVLAVPPAAVAAGAAFELAIGSLSSNPCLLIGNPNGGDVQFVYGYGQLADQVATVKARDLLKLPLTTANTRFVLTTGTGVSAPRLVVQLCEEPAVLLGTRFGESFLLPVN